MSLWTAIVVIVIVGCITGILKERSKARDWHTSDVARKLEERLERLEIRMANIETIILDKDKADRFNDLG